MEIEWRTVQIFIDEEMAISEVSIDAMNSSKLRCNCPKFQNIAGCKHTKFVKDKMKATGGVFNLVLPAEIDDEEAQASLRDTESFRDLVIKYGKIEVL